MAVTVDELIVEIRAETQQLRKGLKDVENQVARAGKAANKSLVSFSGFAKVAGIIGFGKIASEGISTIRVFQDLEATLKAITGSSANAATSIQLIEKFTAGTTFQLENVTSAFTTLLNAGITPTSDTLQDFGNLAAAFGKDITVIAQAAFNATTGEMEMLKQFGIKAKLDGDKIQATFRGVTTEIERDEKAITEFIRNIGATNFPTALEESANTLSGKISNLQDATASFFNQVGQSGALAGLTNLTATFLELTQNSSGAATIIGNVLGQALNGLNRAVKVVADNMAFLVGGVTILGGTVVLTSVMGAASAFITLARSIGLARVAMLALNKVSAKNILVAVAIGAAALTGQLDKLGEKVLEIAKKFGASFDLGDQLDGSIASLDELNAEIEAMTAGLSDVTPEIPVLAQTAEEAFASMRDAIVQSTHAFTTDFVNGLMEGASALEGFKNLAKNIVSQIISTFLQLAVVNQILNAVFSPFIGSGQMEALPTISLGKRASGGAMAGGRPFLVGERGPELFIPHTAGTLRNSNDTRSMGGSGIVINQSINLSTGVAATVRSEVTKMMPTISEVTKASVLEAASRGGKFQKGLLGA